MTVLPEQVIVHASRGCRDANTRLARFAAKPNLVRGPAARVLVERCGGIPLAHIES